MTDTLDEPSTTTADELLDVIGHLHAALTLATAYIETMPVERTVDKTARAFVLDRADVAFGRVRRIVGAPA